MPIYEFECLDYHRFERLMPMAEIYPILAICECGKLAHSVPSLCTMKPDPNWHFGEVIKGKEIQSSSRIRQAKKENHITTLGTRNDVEDMKKAAESARRDKDQELERQTRRYFEETFSATGVVDSFGEVVPGALRNQGNGDIKGTFNAKELAK